jgi:NAD(P)-dependent dehydrogenase (short-subunit alcohol dehydrogenase family)
VELTMRLRDRVAIITGGASGIGRGIAVRFCEEGAAVAICARRPERLEQTAAEIVMDGGTALAVPCDVTDEAQVRQMVERVAGQFGRLDILVNAAGVRGAVGDVTRLSLDEWWQALQVNTTGPLLCARHVIPRMREVGGGAILNIGSLRLAHVKPGAAAYCASKGALLYLTKVMALDHAAERIRVNMISPGLVLTEFTRYVTEEFPTPEEGLRRYGAQYPLGRIGTVEDIAAAAVYLASDEASWVTGAILPVDGGLGTT